jgi:hypothetical protein
MQKLYDSNGCASPQHDHGLRQNNSEAARCLHVAPSVCSGSVAHCHQVMGAGPDGLEGGQVLENGSPSELLAKSSGM